MLQLINDMIWPLLACFILVGIHAYLGIHVIARKVIFVDLALAQIAALGAVYGVYLGWSFEANLWAIKLVSVSFTLLGALLFSFTRSNNYKVPHEAIIGIIYAAVLSLTVLASSNLAHGADEVREMLAGSILWVTPNEVLSSALLYSLVGLVHFIFRKKFFLLSSDRLDSGFSESSIKLWDFLFYASFGVVVTSSVGVGGVLLVFGYLIIPSVIGVMLAHSARNRLLIGWAFGVVASILGVVISYNLDLPSGPTIVVVLALALLIVTVVLELRRQKLKSKVFIQIMIFIFAVLLVVFMPVIFTKFYYSAPKDHEKIHKLSHELSEELIKKALLSRHEEENIHALEDVRKNQISELVPLVFRFLDSSDHRLKSLALNIIGEVKHKQSNSQLLLAFTQEKDDFFKIEIAQSLLNLGDKRALFLLQEIYKSSDSDLAKNDSLLNLKEWLLDAPDDENILFSWLGKIKKYLVYDEEQKKFKIVK